MDYRTWRFSRKERLRYGLEALAVTGILAFCFYNSPWALAVFPLTAFWYFREKGEQLAEERRKELKLQFRDAVQGMAAALAAGYSAENAIREAGRDLRLVYPESADMVQELAAMQRKLDANQTVEEVLGSIRFAAELGAVHLSAYMLQLEEGTPYAARYTESDIDEETQRQIYLTAIAELERLGFHQYEISNFARPGFESRHNLRYWRCEEYLGVGPAAASCLGGRRFVFPRDIDAFLAAENPWSLCEDEGEAGSPEERVAMALRLREGLDCTALEAACPGYDAGAMLQRASRPEMRGLCTVTGRTITLTPEGFLVEGSLIPFLLWG